MHAKVKTKITQKCTKTLNLSFINSTKKSSIQKITYFHVRKERRLLKAKLKGRFSSNEIENESLSKLWAFEFKSRNFNNCYIWNALDLDEILFWKILSMLKQWISSVKYKCQPVTTKKMQRHILLIKRKKNILLTLLAKRKILLVDTKKDQRFNSLWYTSSKLPTCVSKYFVYWPCTFMLFWMALIGTKKNETLELILNLINVYFKGSSVRVEVSTWY